MNKNILLACRDAVIGYDNTVAVNGVSFELERGDYLQTKASVMSGCLDIL